MQFESNLVKHINESESEPVSGYKQASEMVRRYVLEPVKKLESKGYLKNPRLILFGSSVTEPRMPSDLDVLLVYDEYIKPPSGVAEYAYYTESRLHSTLLEDSSPTLEYFDINELKHYDVDPDFIDIPVISTRRLTRFLERSDFENRNLAVERLFDVFGRTSLLRVAHRDGYSLNIEGTSEETSLYLQDLATVSAGIPYLLCESFGINPIDKHYNYRIFGESMERVNPDFALKLKQTPNNTLERKETVSDIINLLIDEIERMTQGTDSEKLGKHISKNIRSSVTSFNTGINFIQGIVLGGAVQVYGEDLHLENASDRNKKYTIPIDREFLAENK